MTDKRICVFCGASPGTDPELFETIGQFARAIVARRIGLVYGGGAVGLMGVTADAVLAAGGEVTGIIPDFLAKHEILHPNITETIVVSDLFERKAKMITLSDGFVCFPGGMGTYDELLEILTWRQLHQTDKPVAIYNHRGYFDPLLDMLSKAESAGFYDLSNLNEVIISEKIEMINSKIINAIT